jgi:hypothetical protein
MLPGPRNRNPNASLEHLRRRQAWYPAASGRTHVDTGTRLDIAGLVHAGTGPREEGGLLSGAVGGAQAIELR